MATTWNPADKTAGVTLSGGNNVATSTTAGQYARATNPVADFEYFELRTVTAISGFNLPGIATSSFDVSAGFGGGGAGKGYILVDGVAFGSPGSTVLADFGAGSSVATFAGTPAANDVYGFARNGTKLYVSRNGTWVIGDPVAGTGSASIAAGTYYPLALLDGSGGSVSQTLQADTPTYSPPSGYTIIGGGGGPSNDLIVTETGPDTAASSGTVNNGPFPTIAARSSARTTASNTTSHAITLPTGIAAGDRLLVVFSVDGNPTVSVNTGVSGSNWQKLGQDSNTTVVTGAVFWKVAEGGDALTLTTSAAEQSSHMALRLTNAAAITGSSANGSSTNSNPPSHTPSGGSNDYLWIATRSGDSTTVATVAPANFSNLQTLAGVGTSSASTNTAERLFAGSVLDPGTFTSGNEQWVSWTIAVAPATPPVSGDLATAESGSDTIVADGSAGAAGAVGDLSASETGADTATGAGAVRVSGALSVNESGSDTAVSAGTVLVSGALSAAETGGDTATAVGAVLVAGTVSTSETGADVFSASGAAFTSGDLSAQETGSDTAAWAGAVPVAGTLVASEVGADAIASSGQVYVLAALAASEQGSDSLAGAGVLLVQGALLVAELGGDALAASGAVAIVGNLAVGEAGTDTFFGSGGAISSGYLDAAESGSDTLAGGGNVPALGALAAVEYGSDTAYLSGAVRIIGGILAAETSADSAVITGAVPVVGVFSAAEFGTDSAALAGRVVVAGGLVAAESGNDTLDASGGLVVAGYFVAAEAGEDSLTAAGFVTEGFPSPSPPAVTLRGRLVLRQTLGAIIHQTSLISARVSGVITLKGRFSASG